LFGEDVVIVKDPNPFSDAGDVLKRFKESGVDELVIVAPLSVIAQIVQRGIKPLWVGMQQVTNPDDAETEAAERYYRFVRFCRIVGVQIQFEEVEPVKKWPKKKGVIKIVREAKVV